MADEPTPVTPPASNAGTNSGLVITDANLAMIVAALDGAVQTAVSQATSQMQEKVNSLSEDLKKVSESVSKAGATDSDSGYLVRSSIDPATSQRNMERYGEIAMANALDFQKGCDAIMIRKLSQDSDHHGALPPIAPRSATGPGTSAS